jgi:diacylglycerol kinase family enzyme
MPKAVLFANPTAQSGRAEELIREARAQLGAAGISHDFTATAPNGGTVGLVRRAIDDSDAELIIYMGGDGTFAEVAKGILASDRADEITLGMLPTGTANDQGKSFGLDAGASAIADNVAIIAAGHVAELDVGRVQMLDEAEQTVASDLFFDSFSVGFGAATLRTRNADRDTISRIPLVRGLYRDQFVYAGALVKKMLDSWVSDIKFDLELEIDGKTTYYKSLLDVIVKNTRIFGGEWVLAPDSEHDDGAFEIVPIAGRRDFTSKLLATYRHSPVDEAGLREIGIEHSVPLRASAFDLTVIHPGAENPPAAQIDGEEFPAGDRFHVECLTRLLRVIAPEDSS